MTDRNWRRAAVRCIAAAAIALAVLKPAPSPASILIEPGFDLFEIDPFGSFVDLSAFIEIIPDPLTVPLQGTPPTVRVGDAPVILERLEGADLIPGEPVSIDIELVALSLVSVDPVDIGGTLFDVLIFNEVPSIGQITITLGVSDPGTGVPFLYGLTLDLVLAKILSEVGEPGNDFFYDLIVTVTGSGTGSLSPSGGIFLGPVLLSDTVFAMNLIPIPEPTTLAIFAIGLAGLGFFMTRRRRAV